MRARRERRERLHQQRIARGALPLTLWPGQYSRAAHDASLGTAARRSDTWTDADDATLRDTLDQPAGEVATRLERTVWAVKKRRLRLGLLAARRVENTEAG